MLVHLKGLDQELDAFVITYDANMTQLDFWRCLERMKKSDFAPFVNREHDIYHQKLILSHPIIDDLIVTFTNKYTNTKSNNKRNRLSMKQAQILYLIVQRENQMKSGQTNSNSNTREKILTMVITILTKASLALGGIKHQEMMSYFKNITKSRHTFR